MADVRTSTGCEPKDLAEDDDLCVKPLFFHRPSMTSTYDSAESIATRPPDSVLDDEQIRALLASPLYLQERESKCGPITSLSLCKKKLSVKFISSSKEYRETRRVVFSKRKSSQEAPSDREDFSSEHQHVPGNIEPLFRFSYPENAMKSFLEEHEEHMLAEEKF